MNLNIISGGAAQGLIGKMEPTLLQSSGLGVTGTFGAVGAMKDKFLAGEPCDLIVLTEALIAELAQAGHVLPDTCAPLGKIATGVAVLEGVPMPDISNADALRTLLSYASALYFPDPERATAGIHFAKVLHTLGLHDVLKARLRPFPNGATAMREMAKAGDQQSVGCTQVTEIVITPGVKLVGPLPKEFELNTVYSVAVSAKAKLPTEAQRFAQMLTSPQSAKVRASCGIV
jgi:molybdate transport system substrate-binding protein